MHAGDQELSANGDRFWGSSRWQESGLTLARNKILRPPFSLSFRGPVIPSHGELASLVEPILTRDSTSPCILC